MHNEIFILVHEYLEEDTEGNTIWQSRLVRVRDILNVVEASKSLKADKNCNSMMTTSVYELDIIGRGQLVIKTINLQESVSEIFRKLTVTY